MKSLAIIPARSGSKGLPDKNIIDVLGRPLIDYTIKVAIESGCFDEIMVSTDSEKYAKIAINCGASVPFLRSEQMSSDSAGSWDVVREVLREYSRFGIKYDYVMLLQPTSPLRTADDIRCAFEMIRDEDTKNVVAVTEVAHPVQWCFTLDQSLSLEAYAQSPYNSIQRQDLDTYYQENGAIYLVDANNIEDADYNLYSDKCRALIMPRSRSIDIDDMVDLLMLKAILKNI